MTIRRWLLAAGVAVATVTGVSALAADTASAPHEATTYDLVGGMSPKALYMLRCSGCHRADGLGAPSAGVPPFPGSIDKIAKDPGGRVYLLHVPGVVSSGLPNAQLAAVMNYVLDEWSREPGAPASRFTAEEVAELRAVKVIDVVAYRRAMAARMAKDGVQIADYPWP